MSIRKGHDFARAQDPTFNLRVLTGFRDHPTKPHLQFKRVDFRRLIPSIIQKEKRFVESLESRKNGQIINYRYSVIKNM
ncbi:MAG: hypothetical protein PHX62_00580 [Bacilli bacterium]|nr:hypothetical protein [Bacilli bacterium]